MRRRRALQVEVVPVPTPGVGTVYDALLDQVGDGLARHILGLEPATDADALPDPLLHRHRRPRSAP